MISEKDATSLFETACLLRSPRNAARVLDIVPDVLRDPFTGLGRPEPLKYLGSNIWSRRLSLEHRVVYLVRDERIDFLQARYHY